MATPAANNHIGLNPPIQVRQMFVNSITTREMRSDTYKPNMLWRDVPINISSNTPKNDSRTKLFFKFLLQVVSSLGKIESDDFGISESEVRERLEVSLPLFLAVSANFFSVELTQDATLFYTLKNGSFSFYIDQYLDEEIGNREEYVITVFKDKNVEFNKTGNIQSILTTIETILTNKQTP